MQRVRFDDKPVSPWIDGGEVDGYHPSIAAAEKMLAEGTGPGNDFLGWLDLPTTARPDSLEKIATRAAEIREKSDLLLCVGIGGSYLGARAAIEFLSPSFEQMRKPNVLFAGHQVNSDYLGDLLQLIEDKEVTVNIISKSGTTTEPGITFRVLRQWMEKKYGRKGAAKRIVATTDPDKGALRKLAVEEGYATFEIPPDIGGRFSVLTPVGLLPIATAGVDIAELVRGARDAQAFCEGESIEDNMSARYAVIRNILFRKGKTTEVLASFQPQLHFVGEWWKQLAGESEGKNGTGIFPASLDYTTDLHSLGQWMQEGVRNVFETFVVLENTRDTIIIPEFEDNSDGLNYLSGVTFEAVNENAFKGTLLAHLDGGVPATILNVEDRSERTLGQLFYFFQKAIALSGYLFRVNPFDQPGVEAYKKNMFGLLAKPGFEEAGDCLRKRIAELGV